MDKLSVLELDGHEYEIVDKEARADIARIEESGGGGGEGGGHTLPENAKEGDLCLYAKPNTLTLAESGKKIYFDWNEFSRPVDEDNETELMAQAIKINGDEENIQIRFARNSDFCECFIEDFAAGTIFQAWFTGGVFDFAHYGVNGGEVGVDFTEYNSIEEIPTYYQLPQFDAFEYNNLKGNAYLFHGEYELMKYQGDEWTRVIPTSEADTKSDIAIMVDGETLVLSSLLGQEIEEAINEIEVMIDESGVLDDES